MRGVSAGWGRIVVSLGQLTVLQFLISLLLEMKAQALSFVMKYSTKQHSQVVLRPFCLGQPSMMVSLVVGGDLCISVFVNKNYKDIWFCKNTQGWPYQSQRADCLCTIIRTISSRNFSQESRRSCILEVFSWKASWENHGWWVTPNLRGFPFFRPHLGLLLSLRHCTAELQVKEGGGKGSCSGAQGTITLLVGEEGGGPGERVEVRRGVRRGWCAHVLTLGLRTMGSSVLGIENWRRILEHFELEGFSMEHVLSSPTDFGVSTASCLGWSSWVSELKSTMPDLCVEQQPSRRLFLLHFNF